MSGTHSSRTATVEIMIRTEANGDGSDMCQPREVDGCPFNTGTDKYGQRRCALFGAYLGEATECLGSVPRCSECLAAFPETA